MSRLRVFEGKGAAFGWYNRPSNPFFSPQTVQLRIIANQVGQCASGSNWREKSVCEYIKQLHGSWFTQIPAAHSTPAMFIPFTFHHDIQERSGSYLDAVKNRFWYEESRFGVIFDRLRIAHFANACMAFPLPHRERIEGTDRFAEVTAWVENTCRAAGRCQA